MAALTIKIGPGAVPEEVRRRDRATRAAIKRGTITGANRGKAMIVPHTPTDLGQLKNSWEVLSDMKLDSFRVLLAELVNTAPHAGIVEMGARPHPVSREGWDAIYEWARRHFGYSVKGGRMRRVKGDTGEDPFLAGITWAIVNKIKREGQRPTYFVRERLPQLDRARRVEIRKALGRVAKRRKPKGKG